MKLHIEAYREALNNLRISKDISWREMERQSGVYNISRIVSGEIKKPTAESWQALHDAFPQDIPEPIYLSGDKVYKNVVAKNRSNASGGKMEVTNNYQQKSSLSAEEQTLINLLREKDPAQDYLRRCIAELILKKKDE